MDYERTDNIVPANTTFKEPGMNVQNEGQNREKASSLKMNRKGRGFGIIKKNNNSK